MSDLHLSEISSRNLQSIGYSWFISKLYHDKIDPMHLNWISVSTVNRRVSAFSRTSAFHKDWVYFIAHSSGKKLADNKIRLSSEEVLTMANKLLLIM